MTITSRVAAVRSSWPKWAAAEFRDVLIPGNGWHKPFAGGCIQYLENVSFSTFSVLFAFKNLAKGCSSRNRDTSTCKVLFRKFAQVIIQCTGTGGRVPCRYNVPRLHTRVPGRNSYAGVCIATSTQPFSAICNGPQWEVSSTNT
eukprot:3607553-Rhodomonas_salina.1